MLLPPGCHAQAQRGHVLPDQDRVRAWTPASLHPGLGSGTEHSRQHWQLLAQTTCTFWFSDKGQACIRWNPQARCLCDGFGMGFSCNLNGRVFQFRLKHLIRRTGGTRPGATSQECG